MRWKGRGATKGGEFQWITGAMVISAVDEDNKIYRRVGWADLADDSIFDASEQSITLV